MGGHRAVGAWPSTPRKGLAQAAPGSTAALWNALLELPLHHPLAFATSNLCGFIGERSEACRAGAPGQARPGQARPGQRASSRARRVLEPCALPCHSLSSPAHQGCHAVPAPAPPPPHPAGPARLAAAGMTSSYVVLRHGSISLVQLLRCSSPVFSAAWAFLLLDERLQFRPLLGLLVTLFGTGERACTQEGGGAAAAAGAAEAAAACVWGTVRALAASISPWPQPRGAGSTWWMAMLQHGVQQHPWTRPSPACSPPLNPPPPQSCALAAPSHGHLEGAHLQLCHAGVRAGHQPHAVAAQCLHQASDRRQVCAGGAAAHGTTHGTPAGPRRPMACDGTAAAAACMPLPAGLQPACACRTYW
jgi:hypothetical protein